jgi:DNA polymerase-3 subunit beta
MKNLFKVNSESLLKAIKKTNKIKLSATLDYLNGVHFDLKGNDLSVRRTDLETDIILNIDVAKDIDSEESASFLINYELLEKGLSTLKNEEISVFMNNLVIVFKHSKGTFEIATMTENLFPRLNNDDFQNQTVIDAKTLSDILLSSEKFTGNDPLRASMMGVYLESKEKDLKFVATNGHVLILSKIKLDLEKEFNVLLPKSSIPAITNLIEPGVDNLIMSFNNQTLKFEINKSVIYSRLINGKFPNYESVIPKEFVSVIKVQKDELINSLNRIKWALPNTKKVLFEKIYNELNISCLDIDFAKSAIVNCPFILFNGDAISKTFSHELFLNCIKAIDSKIVNINITDGNRAIIINSDDSENFTLLMPLL